MSGTSIIYSSSRKGVIADQRAATYMPILVVVAVITYYDVITDWMRFDDVCVCDFTINCTWK